MFEEKEGPTCATQKKKRKREKMTRLLINVDSHAPQIRRWFIDTQTGFLNYFLSNKKKGLTELLDTMCTHIISVRHGVLRY